jgi:hypothetical protein
MVGHGNLIHTNGWRAFADRFRHGVLIATAVGIVRVDGSDELGWLMGDPRA